jgi:anti-anti-sigma factor
MVSDADDSTLTGGYSSLGQVAVGHHARGIAVVTMSGEHDLSTQPAFAEALECAAAHSNVVVDLSDCAFIDSTVIKEFIKTSETVRAKGEQVVLVIPPAQTQIARIAQAAGLSHIFALHESTESAFAMLDRAKAGDEATS